MRNQHIPTLMIGVVLAGCTSTHSVPSTPASAAAASAAPRLEHHSENMPPSSPGADNFAHHATIHTSFSPSAAVHKVTDTFKEMHFSGGTASSRHWPPIPETEDFFFARARAVTADGHSILVECRWVADGFTDVLYSSDLDDAQNTYMLGEIRYAVGGTDEDTK